MGLLYRKMFRIWTGTTTVDGTEVMKVTCALEKLLKAYATEVGGLGVEAVVCCFH